MPSSGTVQLPDLFSVMHIFLIIATKRSNGLTKLLESPNRLRFLGSLHSCVNN